MIPGSGIVGTVSPAHAGTDRTVPVRPRTVETKRFKVCGFTEASLDVDRLSAGALSQLKSNVASANSNGHAGKSMVRQNKMLHFRHDRPKTSSVKCVDIPSHLRSEGL